MALLSVGTLGVFGQREPEMADLQAVADNAKLIADSYLAAAKASPSAAQMLQRVGSLNANESAGITGGSTGCVRDYSKPGAPCATSFLAARSGQSPIAALLRPFISRTTANNSGADVGMFDRKTQAPMVWLKLNSQELHTPAGAKAFADFARSA